MFPHKGLHKPKFLSYPGPAIVPFHQWLILGPCRIWTFSNAESKTISSTLFQDVICEIEVAQFCGFWSYRKKPAQFSTFRPPPVLRHRRYITHFILYMMIQTKQTIHFLKVYHSVPKYDHHMTIIVSFLPRFPSFPSPTLFFSIYQISPVISVRLCQPTFLLPS